MGDFVEQLDPINSVADGSPGFIWRLKDGDGNATGIRILDDHQLLVNMSVWSSVELLKEFVYRSGHAEIMKQKRLWFRRHVEVYLVLWWVPAGHRPSIAEAEERLMMIRTAGPGPQAFDFGHIYPPPP